jgi:hypothetical protein
MPRLDSQARKNVITFLGLWAKGWKEGLKREIKGGIREGTRNYG